MPSHCSTVLIYCQVVLDKILLHDHIQEYGVSWSTRYLICYRFFFQSGEQIQIYPYSQGVCQTEALSKMNKCGLKNNPNMSVEGLYNKLYYHV